MQQLESAAITAAEFARWLHDEHNIPDAPLRSIRLLLSPSNAELDGLSEREREAPRACMANVESAVCAWVETCRSDTGNVAVLYAAGHGIATTSVEPGILLLEDYGAGGMEQ